jgi:hypothetical protein
MYKETTEVCQTISQVHANQLSKYVCSLGMLTYAPTGINKKYPLKSQINPSCITPT